MMVDLASSLA